MRILSLLIAISVYSATGLIGCGNKVNFAGVSSEGIQAVLPGAPQPESPIVVTPAQPGEPIPDLPIVVPAEPQDPPVVVEPTPVEPVEPPPVEPPPVVPEPELNLKAGTCPISGTQVLSCLDCASTPAIQPPPLLSRKAQELLEIMTAGCSVSNKSDAPGYVAPTRQQIVKRLIQCSPTGYPDTAYMSTQGVTVNNLMTSAVAQKNAFGGLYYKSASTDFETYFGMDIQEARNTLCRRHAAFGSNGVYPIEYYDAQISGRPYTLPQIYVKAQVNRGHLRNCMARSISEPNPIQAPVVPGIACSFETAEGQMSQKVVDKFNEWKAQGHTVYFEGFNQCGVMDRPETYLDLKDAPVKLAIKKCQ